jgi:hypothetical protein
MVRMLFIAPAILVSRATVTPLVFRVEYSIPATRISASSKFKPDFSIEIIAFI